MPSTPKPWLTLLAIQTALQGIRTAAGYRTDIGANVSLEETQGPADTTEGITLYSLALTRPDEPDNANAAVKTREFEFTIEPVTPITMTGGVVAAHQRMHDIIEDIEQALTVVPSTPGAIPAKFREVVFATRPAGLNAVMAQYIMSGRYRRDR